MSFSGRPPAPPRRGIAGSKSSSVLPSTTKRLSGGLSEMGAKLKDQRLNSSSSSASTWKTDLDDIGDPYLKKKKEREAAKRRSRSTSPDLFRERGEGSAAVKDAIFNIIGEDPDEKKKRLEREKKERAESKKRMKAEKEERQRREKEEQAQKEEQERLAERQERIRLENEKQDQERRVSQEKQRQDSARKKEEVKEKREQERLERIRKEKERKEKEVAKVALKKKNKSAQKIGHDNVRAAPLQIDVATYQAPAFEKKKEQAALLAEITRRNFILKEVGLKGTKKDLEKLVQAFQPVQAKKGETIVKQGEAGTHFYVIESGKVDFQVNGVTVGSAEAGGTFGERNMLFTAPEDASIVASSDGSAPTRLLRVDQETFRGIMQTTELAKQIAQKAAAAQAQEEKSLSSEKRKSKQAATEGWLMDSTILQERDAIRKALEKHVGLDDLERIKKLGEGQFGEVWLVAAALPGLTPADKTKKKHEFALKMQQTDPDDSTVADMIKGEVTAMKALHHPFISFLYHCYETATSMDILLGLIAGGELWDVINKENEETGEWDCGVPATHARFYGLVLADTLSYIHGQKYVFRDMKPENVMIDHEGYPIIVDFGFAKFCPDKTYTFCGTPNYVSPEIITNSGHNAAADYWALAVVIYEMVTGENPFYYDGLEQMELFQAISEEPYEPIKKEFANPALCDLIEKMLDKESDTRLGMAGKTKGKDIVDHKWFEKLDLDQIRAKKVKAPWVPGEESKPVVVPEPPPPPVVRKREEGPKLEKPTVLENIRAAPLKIDVDTYKAPVHKKEKSQEAFLKDIAKENFVLKDLAFKGTAKDLNTLVQAFQPIKAKQGETIVKQGAAGTHLYVIESGRVEFQVDGVTVGSAEAGGTFGERNMLFSAPENAAIVAASGNKEPTTLFRVDQETFRGIMQTTEVAKESKKSAPPPENEEVSWLEDSKIIRERDAIRAALQKYIKLDDLERIKVLGEGQFGEVWLVAAQLPGVTATGKKKHEFALKMQKKDPDDSSVVDMIKGEIAAMEALHHPFISFLYHFYETKSSLDMLLGLVTGGELWDVINREDKETGEWNCGIPEDHAQFYGLILADTLAYIHGQNYVFRDMKPENVMVDREGYPIIVDFGFAKFCPDKTYTFCGTPNYVAPEIVTNIGHNAAADYWALAVVIYEMVTGENPFFYEGLEQMELFQAITDEPYEPIKKEFANPVVCDLIEKMLEKDPDRRLGMLGASKGKDIVEHQWFDGLDLDLLRAKKIRAPWIPGTQTRVEAPKTEKPTAMKNVCAAPLEINPETFKAPVFKRDEAQETLIEKTTQENFILKDLANGSTRDVQKFVKAFESVEVKKGETIVKQGEVGTHMYLVEEGTVEFKVDGVTVGTAGAGTTFGELNLLFSSNEKATVVAASSGKGPTKLLRVDQATYRGIMQTTEKIIKAPTDATPVLENDTWLKKSKILKKRKAIRESLQKHVGLDDLERISILGQGQFGEVWLVAADLPGTGVKGKMKFALKMQSKEDELRENTAADAIRKEIHAMEQLNHPFIAFLYHTYDSASSLDMLLGLVPGGELFDVIHKEDPKTGEWHSGIPEDHARFYALVVADTLAYMQGQKYVFRDLKPENIMIDGKGYPIIVDFGFAKHCPHQTFTFCGTPNYVGPEIIKNSGHSFGVDHWALGVVIYEMITGENPFYYDGLEQLELYHAICEFPYEPLKDNLSTSARDIVDKLLEKDPSCRLGMLDGMAQGILDHAWFEGLDLARLRAKRIKAPWVPPGGHGDDEEEEEVFPITKRVLLPRPAPAHQPKMQPRRNWTDITLKREVKKVDVAVLTAPVPKGKVEKSMAELEHERLNRRVMRTDIGILTAPVPKGVVKETISGIVSNSFKRENEYEKTKEELVEAEAKGLAARKAFAEARKGAVAPSWSTLYKEVTPDPKPPKSNSWKKANEATGSKRDSS